MPTPCCTARTPDRPAAPERRRPPRGDGGADARAGRGVGSNGPLGHNSLTAHGKAITDFSSREAATWARLLLRMLAAQRPDDQHIPRPRDLAETYHYLHHHPCAYGTNEAAPRRC